MLVVDNLIQTYLSSLVEIFPYTAPQQRVRIS
jgi:hypothetical protein